MGEDFLSEAKKTTRDVKGIAINGAVFAEQVSELSNGNIGAVGGVIESGSNVVHGVEKLDKKYDFIPDSLKGVVKKTGEIFNTAKSGMDVVSDVKDVLKGDFSKVDNVVEDAKSFESNAGKVMSGLIGDNKISEPGKKLAKDLAQIHPETNTNTNTNMYALMMANMQASR